MGTLFIIFQWQLTIYGIVYILIHFDLYDKVVYTVQHSRAFLSTLHFLLLFPDPNPGIAAKQGWDYGHAADSDSPPLKGNHTFTTAWLVVYRNEYFNRYKTIMCLCCIYLNTVKQN